MLSNEGMAVIIAEEEKRLRVNSPEFLRRHNEIMQMIESARQKGEKQDGAGCTDGNIERCIQQNRH